MVMNDIFIQAGPIASQNLIPCENALCRGEKRGEVGRKLGVSECLKTAGRVQQVA